MPPPVIHGPKHNEEIRKYVLNRDRTLCQWPGCGSTKDIDVLFVLETKKTVQNGMSYYKNGIALCPKHMDTVNLHDKAFGPLIYDLIQLVEFEQDLQMTEKVYKELLK